MRSRRLSFVAGWVAVALLAVVGFATLDAEARGGRGGGPRGGGFRPSGNFGGQNLGGQRFNSQNFGAGSKLNNSPLRSNITSGQFNKTQGLFGQNLQTAKSNAVGQAQNKASSLQANFSSKNESFSPAWYADHPGAWQYTHPHADAWAIAGIGAAAAWLGLGGGYGYVADDGTYYTSDDGTTEEEPATTDQTAQTEQQSQPLDAAQLAADQGQLVLAVGIPHGRGASAPGR